MSINIIAAHNSSPPNMLDELMSAQMNMWGNNDNDERNTYIHNNT